MATRVASAAIYRPSANGAAAEDPYSLDRYAEEVMAGLPNEKRDLDCALENQAFYDRDAERYLTRREAESDFDYMGRPKSQSGLTAECVDVLTEHLYAPGPSRQFDNPAGDEFLEQVRTDNLFDALMHRADKLATLNDVCAFQVDAGEGDFAERPITLRLWGREEFHAWTHPDDSTRPVCVVTIDKYDLQTRYRLWGEDEVRTYLTSKAGGTSGGRIAEEVSREPNTYGMVPFAFVHYDLPTQKFITPGPGTFLRKCEVRVNDRMSLIDEAISKHLNPVGVVENMDLAFNPVIEPGRFIRTFTAGPQISGTGGYGAEQSSRIYYLQAQIDVAGAWDDLIRRINQTLESVRVPLSAVRMEQTGVASGIALIAEQAPLLTRARGRRGAFGHFEAQIAKAILTCAGNHYGKADLLTAAETGRLTLGWPEPTIPIPGPDRDEADANAMAMGIKSELMVIQERYGCTRDQALEMVKQIEQDKADVAKLRPEQEAEPDPADPGKDDQGGTDDEQPADDTAEQPKPES